MTKNTLKQLIRKCINESLNENKMDVIASKAARKNPVKKMGENKMDVIASKAARNKPDKNVDENKMDATSAYVPRGEARGRRYDQVAIKALFTELEASTYMKDPLLYDARDLDKLDKGDREGDLAMRRQFLDQEKIVVPHAELRKDSEGLYYHLEIDLGDQKGFLKVYGNTDNVDDQAEELHRQKHPYKIERSGKYGAVEEPLTEDQVLSIIRDRISNELDQS